MFDSHHEVVRRYKGENLFRKRLLIDGRKKNKIKVAGKSVINFCSSDYLCLTNNRTVKKIFAKGVSQYGLGGGASAMVSGYYKPQKLLEEKFSEFLKREKALLFSSGYLANLAVITALAKSGVTLLADKQCHASIIDGLCLAKAKHYRYRHNDLNHLENLLCKTQQALVITESVFSMEGNITPIQKIINQTKQYKAMLLVDDAHGFGVLGQAGCGISDLVGTTASSDIDCLITPLGKACASVGCLVSGKADLIDYLLQFSRSYMYNTALPPTIALGTLKVLDIIQKETWRRERLNYLINYFINGAKARGLPLLSEQLTPIKPILIGNNLHVLKIQKQLLAKGFLVACIRPPTVANNKALIRISLNCEHTMKQIEQLLDLLSIFIEKI